MTILLTESGEHAVAARDGLWLSAREAERAIGWTLLEAALADGWSIGPSTQKRYPGIVMTRGTQEIVRECGLSVLLTWGAAQPAEAHHA